MCNDDDVEVTGSNPPRFSARQIAFTGILVAITVVLGSTPLGFIQIPPIAITVMHVPTILAGVLEGPVIGGLVGLMFGGFSMYQAQTAANPLDKLIFTNPLIAVLPRILVGVVAHYVFRASRSGRGEGILVGVTSAFAGFTAYSLSGVFGMLSQGARAAIGVVMVGASLFVLSALNRRYGHGPALAAAAGSLTNTALVLGLIVAFGFLPPKVALTVGIANGIPEATVAVILTGLIFRATRRFFQSE